VTVLIQFVIVAAVVYFVINQVVGLFLKEEKAA
jgi:large-conductance mechanosensitive channel